jgi:hypothetical protein
MNLANQKDQKNEFGGTKKREPRAAAHLAYG